MSLQQMIQVDEDGDYNPKGTTKSSAQLTSGSNN
jgi:hypothetical protein